MLKTLAVCKAYRDKYGEDPCEELINGLEGVDRVVIKISYFAIYCSNQPTNS